MARSSVSGRAGSALRGGSVRHAAGPRAAGGFTLIEVLVALAILAVMATMGWRGLDGMIRTQEMVRARSDQVVALQAGLAQWQADLDAIAETGVVSALDYDGRVLRMTRRDGLDAGAGLRVVAWSRRLVDQRNQWLRWQSPALSTRAELAEAWSRAQIWARNPVESERRLEVAVASIDEWQIFYYRGDAWTNPLSADAASVTSLGRQIDAAIASTTLATLPDGVRLVLRLSEGQALSGVITRDWVRPVVGGGKS